MAQIYIKTAKDFTNATASALYGDELILVADVSVPPDTRLPFGTTLNLNGRTLRIDLNLAAYPQFEGKQRGLCLDAGPSGVGGGITVRNGTIAQAIWGVYTNYTARDIVISNVTFRDVVAAVKFGAAYGVPYPQNNILVENIDIYPVSYHQTLVDFGKAPSADNIVQNVRIHGVTTETPTNDTATSACDGISCEDMYGQFDATDIYIEKVRSDAFDIKNYGPLASLNVTRLRSFDNKYNNVKLWGQGGDQPTNTYMTDCVMARAWTGAALTMRAGAAFITDCVMLHNDALAFAGVGQAIGTNPSLKGLYGEGAFNGSWTNCIFHQVDNTVNPHTVMVRGDMGDGGICNEDVVNTFDGCLFIPHPRTVVIYTQKANPGTGGTTDPAKTQYLAAARSGTWLANFTNCTVGDASVIENITHTGFNVGIKRFGAGVYNESVHITVDGGVTYDGATYNETDIGTKKSIAVSGAIPGHVHTVTVYHALGAPYNRTVTEVFSVTTATGPTATDGTYTALVGDATFNSTSTLKRSPTLTFGTPMVNGVPFTTAHVGDTVSIPFTASDPDEEVVTYEASGTFLIGPASSTATLTVDFNYDNSLKKGLGTASFTVDVIGDYRIGVNIANTSNYTEIFYAPIITAETADTNDTYYIYFSNMFPGWTSMRDRTKKTTATKLYRIGVKPDGTVFAPAVQNVNLAKPIIESGRTSDASPWGTQIFAIEDYLLFLFGQVYPYEDNGTYTTRESNTNHPVHACYAARIGAGGAITTTNLSNMALYGNSTNHVLDPKTNTTLNNGFGQCAAFISRRSDSYLDILWSPGYHANWFTNTEKMTLYPKVTDLTYQFTLGTALLDVSEATPRIAPIDGWYINKPPYSSIIKFNDRVFLVGAALRDADTILTQDIFNDDRNITTATRDDVCMVNWRDYSKIRTDDLPGGGVNMGQLSALINPGKLWWLSYGGSHIVHVYNYAPLTDTGDGIVSTQTSLKYHVCYLNTRADFDKIPGLNEYRVPLVQKEDNTSGNRVHRTLTFDVSEITALQSGWATTYKYTYGASLRYLSALHGNGATGKSYVYAVLVFYPQKDADDTDHSTPPTGTYATRPAANTSYYLFRAELTRNAFFEDLTFTPVKVGGNIVSIPVSDVGSASITDNFPLEDRGVSYITPTTTFYDLASNWGWTSTASGWEANIEWVPRAFRKDGVVTPMHFCGRTEHVDGVTDIKAHIYITASNIKNASNEYVYPSPITFTTARIDVTNLLTDTMGNPINLTTHPTSVEWKITIDPYNDLSKVLSLGDTGADFSVRGLFAVTSTSLSGITAQHPPIITNNTMKHYTTLRQHDAFVKDTVDHINPGQWIVDGLPLTLTETPLADYVNAWLYTPKSGEGNIEIDSVTGEGQLYVEFNLDKKTYSYYDGSGPLSMRACLTDNTSADFDTPGLNWYQAYFTNEPVSYTESGKIYGTFKSKPQMLKDEYTANYYVMGSFLNYTPPLKCLSANGNQGVLNNNAVNIIVTAAGNYKLLVELEDFAGQKAQWTALYDAVGGVAQDVVTCTWDHPSPFYINNDRAFTRDFTEEGFLGKYVGGYLTHTGNNPPTFKYYVIPADASIDGVWKTQQHLNYDETQIFTLNGTWSKVDGISRYTFQIPFSELARNILESYYRTETGSTSKPPFSNLSVVPDDGSPTGNNYIIHIMAYIGGKNFTSFNSPQLMVDTQKPRSSAWSGWTPALYFNYGLEPKINLSGTTAYTVSRHEAQPVFYIWVDFSLSGPHPTKAVTLEMDTTGDGDWVDKTAWVAEQMEAIPEISGFPARGKVHFYNGTSYPSGDVRWYRIQPDTALPPSDRQKPSAILRFTFKDALNNVSYGLVNLYTQYTPDLDIEVTPWETIIRGVHEE
jgi:hypothetical protein